MSEILKALRKIEEESADYYNDPEYPRLSWERECERHKERTRPTCCERASKFINCTFEEGQEAGTPPVWRHKFNDLKSQGVQEPKDFDPEYFGYVRLSFCPFCGTKLPELRKKAVPPEFIQSTEDEYYCTCCKERLHQCLCSHPTTAWEVVPKFIQCDATLRSSSCSLRAGHEGNHESREGGFWPSGRGDHEQALREEPR